MVVAGIPAESAEVASVSTAEPVITTAAFGRKCTRISPAFLCPRREFEIGVKRFKPTFTSQIVARYSPRRSLPESSRCCVVTVQWNEQIQFADQECLPSGGTHFVTASDTRMSAMLKDQRTSLSGMI
jgi:hypothetical protein